MGNFCPQRLSATQLIWLFEYLTIAVSFMVVMIWNHYINLQVSPEYCLHSWSWTSSFRCQVTHTGWFKSVQLFWLDMVGSVSLSYLNYRCVPHLRRESRIWVRIAWLKFKFYCLGSHFPLLSCWGKHKQVSNQKYSLCQGSSSGSVCYFSSNLPCICSPWYRRFFGGAAVRNRAQLR